VNISEGTRANFTTEINYTAVGYDSQQVDSICYDFGNGDKECENYFYECDDSGVCRLSTSTRSGEISMQCEYDDQGQMVRLTIGKGDSWTFQYF